MMSISTTHENFTCTKPIAPETVSELTHRHLRDQHHITTDEELRNVILHTSEVLPPGTGNKERAYSKKANHSKDQKFQDVETHTTPWDVMS